MGKKLVDSVIESPGLQAPAAALGVAGLGRATRPTLLPSCSPIRNHEDKASRAPWAPADRRYSSLTLAFEVSRPKKGRLSARSFPLPRDSGQGLGSRPGQAKIPYLIWRRTFCPICQRRSRSRSNSCVRTAGDNLVSTERTVQLPRRPGNFRHLGPRRRS